jgi:hypothetical protein
MQLICRGLMLLCALALLACAGPPPIVQHHSHAQSPGVLAKVAVVPFYPRPGLVRSSKPGSVSAKAAADLVSRFMTEALADGGVRVIAPSDLIIAFEGEGRVLPRTDVASTAQLAARAFGATAVLLGEVVRYREREGGPIGARHPASVWFKVTLYSAPAGRRIFSARFEQTQPSLSANPLVVSEYPGSGTRWLSAAELARWGAERIVASLPEGLW